MSTTSNGVVLGDPPPGCPHLAIPFSLASDGSAVTLQQGSAAEIVQCVANLVGTRPGTRFLQPAYGIPDPTFGAINQPALTSAVAKYEPRATVGVVATADGGEYVQVGVAGGTQ